MNKKLTLIFLTNLVITGSMVTDASASIDPEEQFLLAPQIELSPAERIDQLMQQANILTGYLNSLIEGASNVSKELGTLRKQIEKETRTAESQTDDLMPHKINALIQADGPDTFVWDGIGAVPKDVTKVRIADGVTRIEPWIFYMCKLGQIVIPDSVTNIGYAAFSKCKSLEKIDIPNSVTSIDGFAFSECTSLENIIIPNGVTRIESNVFVGCIKLKSIIIPKSVTYIGLSAFSNCESLKNIDIPDSVTIIADEAFSDCKSLENIVIPDNVTYIGDYAFRRCTGLKNVNMPSRFKGQKGRLGIPAGCTVTYN